MWLAGWKTDDYNIKNMSSKRIYLAIQILGNVSNNERARIFPNEGLLHFIQHGLQQLT